MFKRLNEPGHPVTLQFEGKPLIADRDDTVAAALLAAGVIQFRDASGIGSAGSATKRGPWCMIGNCFECLLEIDGNPNQQSCRRPVRDGMQIRRQRAVDPADDHDAGSDAPG